MASINHILLLLAVLWFCQQPDQVQAVVQIKGSIANHVDTLFKKFIASYERSHKDTHITYGFAVSDTVLKAVASKAVNFGVTQNTPPTNAECLKGGLNSFPLFLGTGSLYHNIPGVNSLVRLDACTQAGIFAGKINWWNDFHIVRLNPHLKNIHQAIKPIVRLDPIARIPLNVQYLEYWRKECPRGKLLVGSKGDGTNRTMSDFRWPEHFKFVRSIPDTAATIDKTPYAIGWVQTSSNLKGKAIAIQNHAGQYITGFQADMTSLVNTLRLPSNSLCLGSIDPTSVAGKGVYPITYFLYFIARLDQRQEGQLGIATKGFGGAWLTPEAQNLAASFGFYKLPATTLAQAKRFVNRIQTSA